MLLVSLKIFIPHFQSIENMNRGVFNTDIVLEGSYKVGIELIFYAVLCGTLGAFKIIAEKFNGLFDLLGVFALLCRLLSLHIRHPVGELAAFCAFFHNWAHDARLYFCSDDPCLIKV